MLTLVERADAHLAAIDAELGPDNVVHIGVCVDAEDERRKLLHLDVLAGEEDGFVATSFISVNRMQDTPLRSMARRCWPKEQHKTEGAAEAQLRSITKRDLEKDLTKIHTYECPDCGMWHVGHGRGGDA